MRFQLQPSVLVQEPCSNQYFFPLKALILIHHSIKIYFCDSLHCCFQLFPPPLYHMNRRSASSTPALVSSRLSEKDYSFPAPTCVDLQGPTRSSFSAPCLSALCLPCLTVWTTSHAPQVQLVFLAWKCFLFKWAHPSKEFRSLCNCPHCCLSLRVVCKFCQQRCCNSRPLKKMLKNIIFNVS